MATAQRVAQDSKKQLVEVWVEQPDIIRLDLTTAEAQVLRNILGSVGGSPQGLRKHSDHVLGALDKIGFSRPSVAVQGSISI